MICKLTAIICCNGSNFTNIWQQHRDNRLSQCLSVLSFGKFSGHKDYTDDFPEYNWRRQNRDGVTNWILNSIKGCLADKDEIKISELYTYIENAAKDTDYQKSIRYRTQFALNNYTGPGKPFLLKDNILKKNIAIFDSIDFEIIGLKGGKYPFFTQIRSIILNAIKRAEDGRILLTDAVRLVNESIDERQNRNTVIRAITNKHLPAISVTLLNIDGNLYIVKSGEEIASEPKFEVKSSADTKGADDITEVKTLDDRPSITYRLTLDWDELETSIKRELKYYGKLMDFEHIDFDKAATKFIGFIKNADNHNLRSRLPQYLYEYWYAKTDFHDRETYVSQLAIFFESLLSEIRYRKDGVRLRKSGLGEWMREFGIARVLTIPPLMAKGFERIYKDIYYKRNKFAHGEAVEMSSSETAKTISDYVALYIYTVARYA